MVDYDSMGPSLRLVRYASSFGMVVHADMTLIQCKVKVTGQ